MEQHTSSQEYPDDYIEIVNEINDFIASLTGTSADASASSGSQSEEVYLRDSLENDYEPIESLPSPPPSAVYLAPPTPPRPYIRVMAEGAPKHVKALHNFKGTNNDELCFSKGDIITVTQVMEGGWWEGTLNGKTGWFPSNYAKEVRTDMPSAKAKGSDVTAYKRESMQIYHNVVLKNIIETERAHVAEISRVLQTYILPLKNAGILGAAEYSLIAGNLEEIEAFQTKFLAALEECEKLPPLQRRVGGIFMKHAQQLKDLYRDYCANHPKAVAVLQRRRDDLSRFMESQGAQPPGAMTLTTHLSKPFTRLERYPSLLKELERHIEESHPDRGDTQRAIAVYRDIANSCMEIRKLKEMEYEIITSTIHGWEGEEISKLGEVLHLSQVKVHRQTGEKYDRIFVLFSNVLVMLSMSPRLSGYQYEGILPLSGMMVNKCEDAENFVNGFELSGTMIDKMIVTCGTKLEVASWLDVLSHQVKQSHNVVASTKPQSLQVSTSQPSISTVTVQAKTAKVMHSPQPKTNKVWNTSCLRPAPPLRPTLMCREDALKSPRTGRKSTQKRKPVRTYSGDEYAWRRYDPKVYNEDAFILEVIEAYCNSAKTRHTVNSCRRITSPDPRNLKAILNAPQVLIADEEKIIDDSGDQEKTLVDTVYSLKDKVRALEQEQKKLKKELEDERKARKKLESYVRQTVGSGMMDHTKDNGAT